MDDVDQFAHFLAVRLVQRGPGHFEWKFQLPDVPIWARGLGAGDTLEESDRLLTATRDHILAALADGRAEAVREGIRVIMQWGGVWGGQGPGHGNANTVMAIPGPQLLADLRADLKHMADSKWGEVMRMNSGWSKVVAVLVTEPPLIIYDSRVARALARRLVQFEQEELGGQPSPLRGWLPQLPGVPHAGGPGPIPNFPNMNNNVANHARAICIASEIVRRVLALADTDPALHNAWFRGKRPRDIEARLFTLGA